MDPEITALAGTAGTTLVTLLTTESWQRIRDRFAALWSRTRSGREIDVAEELEATREELLAARAGGDSDLEADVTAEWQSRIRRLMASHPAAVDDLRALLADYPPSEDPTTTVTQHAVASGSARVYQAGRDMHLKDQP
ncbi:hypothetical protein ACWEQ8_10250 [Streptomyces noursei]